MLSTLITSLSTLSLLSPMYPSSGRTGATSLVQAGHKYRSEVVSHRSRCRPRNMMYGLCSPKILYCSPETQRSDHGYVRKWLS